MMLAKMVTRVMLIRIMIGILGIGVSALINRKSTIMKKNRKTKER